MADSERPAPSSGVFEGREHLLPVRVYYEDTDFTGLVYHAGYLRFLERGRSDYLRLIGISHQGLLERPDPCAFVVTRMQIDFLAPARIDDVLIVRTAYDAILGPRLMVSQSIRRGGLPIAQAVAQAACITPAGRARRPPKDLVACLAPHLAIARTP
jgi:acyl-CoA thioester hydrolase